MNAPDFADAQIEAQRSKVKVTRNAKGEPQWEITVLVGEEESAIENARRIAVAMNQAMEEAFGFRPRVVA
ncbi:MAG: hypothetical protein ACRDM0_11825 [Thermoleophilaceae bacterium]